MRASRAKKAAPDFYPRQSSIPEHREIKGVPVEFILEFAQQAFLQGNAYSQDQIVSRDQIVWSVGGIEFYFRNNSKSERYRNTTALTVSANEWSCTLEMLNIMMGGSTTFSFFNRSYIIIDYSMQAKHAWLRDMSIARMMTDEWKGQ